MNFRNHLAFALLTISLYCPSAFAAPETRKSLLDSIVPKKELPLSQMGINSFANDRGFGTVKAQLNEVRSTLGLRYNRVLFAWNDQVQRTPTTQPNFSFYDDITRNLPRGSDMLIVVTGLPSWMKSPSNWINGNPRETFVKLWVEPILRRYGAQSKVIGFQMWNEPNMEANPDNAVMGFALPENYLNFLSFADDSFRNIAPRKKLVMAATTAINQNFPNSLNYNKALLEGGAANLADVWAIHYYGNDIVNIIRPDGVKDFSRTVTIPIWMTESGTKGQLSNSNTRNAIGHF